MAEHGIEWMLFYFIVFYLPFSAETFAVLTGQSLPILTATWTSRSVWTEAGLSFCFLSLSGLTLPLRTSGRLCWYVMWWLMYRWKWRRGSIWLHIHPLTSNFYPREKYAKRLSFLSVQVLRSHVRSRWHQAMSKITSEPLVFSERSILFSLP